ncbi:MAG TPA: hypothetical protein VFV72_07060 [Candidatus Limnocylindrales bacterium]|nr:hypothetical protein [Candidatus Limnocylindrales bacterium]
MRLSEWRAAAPTKDAGGSKLAALVDPVLAGLGVAPDPHCWIVWGEDPGTRHTILVPTDAGLVTCFVRVLVPAEAPRATAKLVRWSRVELGELAMETSAGHRLLSFQVEGHVLQGADDIADQIAAFALDVFAAMDGRPRPEPPSTRRRTGPTAAVKPAARGRASGSRGSSGPTGTRR